MTKTDPRYTPRPINFPCLSPGRMLLGAATLACLAGEVSLQITQQAKWDALGVVSLCLPAAALVLLLGVEHTHDLNRLQRWGSRAAILFIVAAVMFNSITRTEGALGSVLDGGNSAVKQQDRLTSDLKSKKAEAAEWRKKEAAESANRGCGNVCIGYGTQAAKAEADAKDLAAQLAAVKVDPAAIGFAQASLVTHTDAAVLAVYEPLLVPFGLQLVVIFAGSAAFGPGRRAVETPKPVAISSDAEIERVSRYLLQLLAAGGRIGSVSELAELAQVHVSNASRAASHLMEAGKITKVREGRCVALRLVA